MIAKLQDVRKNGQAFLYFFRNKKALLKNENGVKMTKIEKEIKKKIVPLMMHLLCRDNTLMHLIQLVASKRGRSQLFGLRFGVRSRRPIFILRVRSSYLG